MRAHTYIHTHIHIETQTQTHTHREVFNQTISKQINYLII